MALIIALSCLGLLRLLWPGDASFVCDEPALIDRAWQANQRGQLSVLGLRGTRGLHYGPLPLWIYQALLTITDDVVTLAAIKAGLVALLCAMALYWIARSVPSLSALGGSLALLSPYLWLYGRDLWDNSFCIPLSALSFAAYVAFLRTKQRWALLLLTLGLSCLVLTHLMSLALIVPLLLHLLLTQHRWLRQHLCFAACCLAGALLLCGSYVGYLIRAPMAASLARTEFGLEQLILPLMGARFFSLAGLGYFFGQDWPLGGRWVLVAAYITWIAFGLVAIGIYHSIREVHATWKSRQSLAFNLHTASLAIIGGQVGEWVLMRLDDHPHYFNATWFIGIS